MYAIREIHFKLSAAGGRVIFHFVNRGRTESLTWVAVFLSAPRGAQLGVQDVQMRGLVLIMADTRVIDIRYLVEGQFLVEL